MSVKIVQGKALIFPDEACDKILPEITDRVCNQCDLKHLCPMHDETDPENEGCRALAILERLFLNGKISFKEASVAENVPPGDQKRVYNLEGL